MAMRNRCPVGASLFLLLKRQSKRQSSAMLSLLLEGMVGMGTSYLGRAMPVCAWPLPLVVIGVTEHCKACADVG